MVHWGIISTDPLPIPSIVLQGLIAVVAVDHQVGVLPEVEEAAEAEADVEFYILIWYIIVILRK
jgi:hypothetical protein